MLMYILEIQISFYWTEDAIGMCKISSSSKRSDRTSHKVLHVRVHFDVASCDKELLSISMHFRVALEVRSFGVAHLRAQLKRGGGISSFPSLLVVGFHYWDADGMNDSKFPGGAKMPNKGLKLRESPILYFIRNPIFFGFPFFRSWCNLCTH